MIKKNMLIRNLKQRLNHKLILKKIKKNCVRKRIKLF